MFTTITISFGEDDHLVGELGQHTITNSKTDFLNKVEEISGDEIATFTKGKKGVTVYLPEETELEDIGDRAYSSSSASLVFYTNEPFSEKLLKAFYGGQSLSRFVYES